MSKRDDIRQIGKSVTDAARRARDGWCRFWFQPSDPYGLAVCRLLAGGMLLYSHLVWGLELRDFFADDGWNNAGVIRALQEGSYAWSFWWYVPQAWMTVTHVMCCMVIALFFMGAFTRVTAPLSWVIAVSYVHRAMLANYGLDQILCALVLYLAISPCGRCLSVDAWRNARTHEKTPRVRTSVMATVSSRLIQIHLCVIYLFAGMSKLQGESWWDGSAVWETLANYEYQSLDLTFLAAIPFVTQLATHTTVLWELSYAALVWNKHLRPFVLIIGVGMHFGIGMFLGMWTFGLAMTFGYVTFLSPQSLRVFLHRYLRVPQWTIGVEEPLQRAGQAKARKSTRDETPARVRGLIIVSKSPKSGAQAAAYFRRYCPSVQIVDGMVQALAISKIGPGHTVIYLGCDFNEAEVEHWASHSAQHDAPTKFVFCGQSMTSDLHGSNYCCLQTPVPFRVVRLAVEQINDCTLKKSGVPIDMSSNLIDDLAKENDTELNSSEQNQLGQTTRFAQVSVLLLALSALSGCSGGDDPISLLNRARTLNDRGSADEALTLLAKVQSLDPGNRDAFYLQGIAHEQNGAFEKAIDAYDRCLLKDPQHTDSLNNRGVLHGRQGDFERALEDLRNAITINPNDALAWSNLGLAYHELGQFDSAIKTYEKAIQLTPNAQVLFQRGNAHYANHSYDAAIADYSKAVELDNGFARAYLNRGMAHWRSGDRDAGYRDLDLAEKYDDDMTVAAVVDSIRLTFRTSRLQERAVRATREWLEQSGWQTHDHPAFHFTATKSTAIESSSIPAHFNAVVMVSDENEEIIADAEVAQASLDQSARKCLFVVEGAQLDGSSIDETTKQPFWLLQADYDWKPVKAQFKLHTVRYVLPEQADIESEGPMAAE